MLEKPRIGEGVLQYKWRLSMSINMEFRNVVFNAARDGKLRRLKVSSSSALIMSWVTSHSRLEPIFSQHENVLKSSVELHFCGLWLFSTQVVFMSFLPCFVVPLFSSYSSWTNFEYFWGE